MTSITPQRNVPSQQVAFSQALRNVPRSMRLNGIRNGDALKRPCAPCGSAAAHGIHQQQVHADSLSAAVEVMKAAREAPSASAAQQKELANAISRLCDRSQLPYGQRVIHQLTALGAVHAGVLAALQSAGESPSAAAQVAGDGPGASDAPGVIDAGDACDISALQRTERDLRAAIIKIGRCAGAIGKGEVSGYWDANSAKSRALVKAIKASDMAMHECRAVMGDADLFASMAGAVLGTAMLNSISERLPKAAECFRNGADGADVAELINVLQRHFTLGNEQRINHLLSSGEPVDFLSAVFELMALPEYVASAVEDTPEASPETPAAPAQGAGGGLRGDGNIGHQAVGNNGNQKMVGGNVTGGNVTVNNSMGDLGKQIRRISNDALRAGQRLGRAEALLEVESSKAARARAKSMALKAQLKERDAQLGARSASGSGAGAVPPAMPGVAQAAAKIDLHLRAGAPEGVAASEAPAVASSIADTGMAAAAAVAIEPPARETSSATTPAAAMMAELKRTLGAWRVVNAADEPSSGVVNSAAATPSRLGIGRHAGVAASRSPMQAVFAQLKVTVANRQAAAANDGSASAHPADAVISQLRTSFGSLPPLPAGADGEDVDAHVTPSRLGNARTQGVEASVVDAPPQAELAHMVDASLILQDAPSLQDDLGLRQATSLSRPVAMSLAPKPVRSVASVERRDATLSKRQIIDMRHVDLLLEVGEFSTSSSSLASDSNSDYFSANSAFSGSDEEGGAPATPEASATQRSNGGASESAGGNTEGSAAHSALMAEVSQVAGARVRERAASTARAVAAGQAGAAVKVELEVAARSRAANNKSAASAQRQHAHVTGALLPELKEALAARPLQLEQAALARQMQQQLNGSLAAELKQAHVERSMRISADAGANPPPFASQRYSAAAMQADLGQVDAVARAPQRPLSLSSVASEDLELSFDSLDIDRDAALDIALEKIQGGDSSTFLAGLAAKLGLDPNAIDTPIEGLSREGSWGVGGAGDVELSRGVSFRSIASRRSGLSN